MLISEGADVNYPVAAYTGYSPLILAVEKGSDMAIIQALIQHGANLNHQVVYI